MSSAEQFAQLADQLTAIIELSAGHRERCKEAGFSEPVAQEMAAAVHNGLIAFVTGGKKQRVQ